MLESWYLVMNKYVPFLKFKQNEIMALRELSLEIKEEIVPFFDFPRKNNMTELDFIGAVSKMEKRLARHLDGIDTFYLDNYDIEEDLFIDGADSYKYLIKSFPNMIPVLGIDRSSEHNDTVFSAKQNGLESPNVALRLTFEDFESFELVESDIEDFLGDTIRLFDAVDLIFDCRYTGGMNENIVSIAITNFANLFSRKFTTNKIIVTGTSIPVPINSIVSTESEAKITRKELTIICQVKESLPHVHFGDYTVVGADYSDADIEPQFMMNVMTPKTVYSYDNYHLILRGGAIKTHPEGNYQFNNQARVIVSKPFFRGSQYSFGDEFLEQKSRDIGRGVMPGTILKPTINAHITYMMLDYIC